MRPTKHNHPLSFYAAKWHTSTVTASSYAKRGCDWDASDYDVALWLLKYTRKRSPAMHKAIYAVPGISDGINPEQTAPLGELDYHAFGKLMTLWCDIEAQEAELKEGDTEGAIRLHKEVVKLDAMTARLKRCQNDTSTLTAK